MLFAGGAIPGFLCSLNFSSTPEHAVADALTAGVAIDCGPFGGPCDNGHGIQQGGNASYGLPSTMHAAVAQGLITEAMVNEAFKTAYRVLFRAGLFDPPEQVPWASIGMEDYGSAEHRRLAYEMATQSIVLLENSPKVAGRPEPMLPLRAGLKLAVLGRCTQLCSMLSLTQV